MVPGKARGFAGAAGMATRPIACIALLLLGTPLAAVPASAGHKAQARQAPARPAPLLSDRARTCALNGGAFTGVLIPGTDICTRAGGFVRWQGTSGTGPGAAGAARAN